MSYIDKAKAAIESKDSISKGKDSYYRRILMDYRNELNKLAANNLKLIKEINRLESENNQLRIKILSSPKNTKE